MYRQPVEDALCAAETVVGRASDPCESNAAACSFAPLILLSLLEKTLSPFLAPSQKEKETDLNCSVDFSCRTDIYHPRWGNVIPVYTPCSSSLSNMLQTRLSASWKMRLLPCLVHRFCSHSMPASCNCCGAFYIGLGDGGRLDQQRICRRS